jgi:dipeptidyl aminopeptidase/acylaminoacyl peptidase
MGDYVGGRPKARRIARAIAGALLVCALAAACRQPIPAAPSEPQAFSFRISVDKESYQIDGYLARTAMPGRRPALLVLNAGPENARRCAKSNRDLTVLGIQVACVSIPGYGGSWGPSRFAGSNAVVAARRALDLLCARPDVDPNRVALWGLSDGAVAAGLLMDSDPRLRAVILQSGAYDTLRLWPEAPLRTKLSILRQVWPSRRALSARSVIGHLPRRVDCSVLILHGERDDRMPVRQARQLALELRARGARVETHYFPKARHVLGARVKPPLREFLRETLLAQTGEQPPTSSRDITG